MNRLTPVMVFVILAIAFPLVGAWWGAWLAGAFVGFFYYYQRTSRALINGFLLGFVVSMVWSLILWMDGGNLISQKIAQIFSLPNGLSLILIAAIVNGLLALLGAGLGSSLRQLTFRS